MKNRSNLQSQHPPTPHHLAHSHRSAVPSQAAPPHGDHHDPTAERNRKLKRHNEHPD